MNANEWERRVVNRVPENTILSAENVLKFFDKELEQYGNGSKITHNGIELEKGIDFDIVDNEIDDKPVNIRLKRQLQPNDGFGVIPAPASSPVE